MTESRHRRNPPSPTPRAEPITTEGAIGGYLDSADLYIPRARVEEAIAHLDEQCHNYTVLYQDHGDRLDSGRGYAFGYAVGYLRSLLA